jgi:hypothetical protein
MEDVVTHVSGRALGIDGLDSRKTYAKALASRPKIEIFLHTQEKFGSASRKLGETQSHVCGDCTAAAQYGV